VPPLTLRIGADYVTVSIGGTETKRSAAVASLVAPNGASRWSARLITAHGQPKAAALRLLADALRRLTGARLRIVTSSQSLLDVMQCGSPPVNAATRRLHNGFKELLKSVTQVQTMSFDGSAAISDALLSGCALDSVEFSTPFEHTSPRKRGRGSV